MTKQNYVPKLSVVVSTEQKRQLDKIFPHGVKRRFFVAVVNWCIYRFEKEGRGFMTNLLINGEAFDEEFLPYLTHKTDITHPTYDLISDIAVLCAVAVDDDVNVMLRKIKRAITHREEC